MRRLRKSSRRPASWRMCSATTACTRSPPRVVIDGDHGSPHTNLVLRSGPLAASRRMDASTFVAILRDARKSALLRMRRVLLVLAEHDRRHPAGHQRHEGHDQTVGEAVLAGGGGDELFEA